MKERPILFSAPMVRAILEGRKWQTRRVIKNMPPQPSANCHERYTQFHNAPYFDTYCDQDKTECNPQGKGDYWCWWQVDNRQCLPVVKCPFGKPSDRLWVREAFAEWKLYGGRKNKWEGREHYWGNIIYRASFGAALSTICEGFTKWKPSLHMPRWASRITLEITDIRAEKLQDISEEDAIAEGAQYFPDIPVTSSGYHPPRWSMKKPVSTMVCLSSARMAFANFINELHGGKNWNLKLHSLWEDNPWVWVIEFKRVES